MTIRTRAMLGFGAMGAGFVLAWTALPLHLPVLCPFRLVTGYPCASCGLTHAVCALAHGQFRAAEEFNLAAVPLAALGLVGVLALGAEVWTDRPWVGPLWKRWKRGLTAGIVVLMATAWVFHFVKLPV